MRGPDRTLVAVVPARGGSKGLPEKNVRPLAGRPLYAHSVQHARLAGADRIIVSTDIPEILDAPIEGAEVRRRPAALAGDDVPMAPVLVDALDDVDDADVVLLQPTSPLRTLADVEACLEVFRTGEYDIVMSVAPADSSVLKWGTRAGDRFEPLRSPDHVFANRQSLPEVLRPNGAIYVFDAAWLARRGTLATDSIGVHVMGADRSIDIDSLADFESCERLLMQEADLG